MVDDDQAALLAQIKALSGAIDKRKFSARGGGYHQPSNRGSSSSYGRGRAAGSSNATTSRHRSLVLSGPSAVNKSDKEVNDAESEAAASSTHASSSNADGEEGWVKRKSTHNMSLVSSSAFKKT
jgi:hypothetical protein